MVAGNTKTKAEIEITVTNIESALKRLKQIGNLKKVELFSDKQINALSKEIKSLVSGISLLGRTTKTQEINKPLSGNAGTQTIAEASAKQDVEKLKEKLLIEKEYQALLKSRNDITKRDIISAKAKIKLLNEENAIIRALTGKKEKNIGIEERAANIVGRETYEKFRQAKAIQRAINIESSINSETTQQLTTREKIVNLLDEETVKRHENLQLIQKSNKIINDLKGSQQKGTFDDPKTKSVKLDQFKFDNGLTVSIKQLEKAFTKLGYAINTQNQVIDVASGNLIETNTAVKNIKKTIPGATKSIFDFKRAMGSLSILFFAQQVTSTFQRMATSALTSFMTITQAQTEAGKSLTALSATWEYFKFSVGNALATALQPLIPTLISLIEIIANFVAEHPNLVAFAFGFALLAGFAALAFAQIILLGSGLETLFGAEFLAKEGLTGKMKEVGKSIGAFLITPTGAAIAAFALLAIAALTSSEESKEAMKASGSSIVSSVNSMIESFFRIFGINIDLGESWDWLGRVGATVFTWIAMGFEMLGQIIERVFLAIENTVDRLKTVFWALFGVVEKVANAIIWVIDLIPGTDNLQYFDADGKFEKSKAAYERTTPGGENEQAYIDSTLDRIDRMEELKQRVDDLKYSNKEQENIIPITAEDYTTWGDTIFNKNQDVSSSFEYINASVEPLPEKIDLLNISMGDLGVAASTTSTTVTTEFSNMSSAAKTESEKYVQSVQDQIDILNKFIEKQKEAAKAKASASVSVDEYRTGG